MCVLNCHAKDYRELCLSICEDVLKTGVRRNLKVFSVILYNNGSLKFEITAKRLYAASQRVL